MLLSAAIETAKMDLLSAHLLTITYDVCDDGSPNEAILAMDGILEYEPNHSRALLVKGKAFYKLKDPASAILFYEKALLVNPSSVKVYIGLAKIYHEADQDDVAVNMLKKASEIDDNHPLVLGLLDTMRER